MKRDVVYLDHIREAIERITAYSAAGREEFFRNRMAQDAVIRNFEIIGEAVRHLSDDLKGRRPDVPWRRVAGFRLDGRQVRRPAAALPPPGHGRWSASGTRGGYCPLSRRP